MSSHSYNLYHIPVRKVSSEAICEAIVRANDTMQCSLDDFADVVDERERCKQSMSKSVKLGLKEERLARFC